MSVDAYTYFGIELNLSANSPSRKGHAWTEPEGDRYELVTVVLTELDDGRTFARIDERLTAS